jgi:hypothetical protein
VDFWQAGVSSDYVGIENNQREMEPANNHRSVGDLPLSVVCVLFSGWGHIYINHLRRSQYRAYERDSGIYRICVVEVR